MPKVRCSVNDCTFWERNNQCSAEEVEVRNDAEVPNMEIGEIAGEQRGRTSAKTCCKTYKSQRNR
ncbi:MAG TPA: DUF1540 domain-containing protein [Firmicutes bacterium]|nr:DUF1540 domain-containing protein [Bacillota bacterium]